MKNIVQLLTLLCYSALVVNSTISCTSLHNAEVRIQKLYQLIEQGLKENCVNFCL